MWCIPEITLEYIVRMEDVLDIYAEKYNPDEPVICFDEKSVQLLKDCREPIPLSKSGSIRKVDSEYIRCGTANIFAAVEPKGGKHFTYVTKNRKGAAFAKVINRLANVYSHTKTIHLVMDNLNTHREKSLIDFYGEEKGKAIWNRFTIHHTPKHGSWLNQAELELSIISRQCLGKSRIDDIDSLSKKIRAWNKIVNREKLKIKWKFTTKDARTKFKY